MNNKMILTIIALVLVVGVLGYMTYGYIQKQT